MNMNTIRPEESLKIRVPIMVIIQLIIVIV